MPEMRFEVRWPDGSGQSCYSPSLVVEDHLEVGAAYPVGEFVARSRTALTLASERVRERFGFSCPLAAASLAQIEGVAQRQPAGGVVVVEAFHR